MFGFIVMNLVSGIFLVTLLRQPESYGRRSGLAALAGALVCLGVLLSSGLPAEGESPPHPVALFLLGAWFGAFLTVALRALEVLRRKS